MVYCLGFFSLMEFNYKWKSIPVMTSNPRKEGSSVGTCCRLSAILHSPEMLKVLSVLLAKDKYYEALLGSLLSFSFSAVYFYLSTTRQTYLALPSLFWSFR